MTLHTVSLVSATLGVGWLMAKAGLQKSALEWKKRRQVCPSCGRQLDVCRCA